jgi:hypothetical protein
MWKPSEEEISVAQMDEAIVVLRQLDNEKKAAKAKADEASKAYTEQQTKVMKLMEAAGKEEYVVTGYGKVRLSEMLSVRTPKSPDEKQRFFNWVRENMGEDSYYHYMSVNSQSLNALYKEKVEEFGARGELLEIDGIEAPTSYTKMSFTKA